MIRIFRFASAALGKGFAVRLRSWYPRAPIPICCHDRATVGLQAPRSQCLPAGHLGSASATEANALTDRIASREGCSVRKVNMTISLAFLAPDLVKAAIDGRLPYGMGA
jgi:hypothetical protein